MIVCNETTLATYLMTNISIFLKLNYQLKGSLKLTILSLIGIRGMPIK